MAGDRSTPRIRAAGIADAGEAGRLLHDFNTEFGNHSPGVEAMADRCRELLAADEIGVLLAGGDSAHEPLGIAVLRFRPALWSQGSEAYLEELYVVPPQRGRGIGRALMDAALDLARKRGCGRIDLGTAEGDVAARALYESLGFTNTETDGTTMLYYERDL